VIGAAAAAPLSTAFDDFLYAPIGEERNGTVLTVVSALARQNIDPWAHALHLSRLPGQIALRELTSLIEALPAAFVTRPAADAIAARLIALLPKLDSIQGKGGSPQSAHAGIQAGASRWLPIVLGYLCILLASQWLLAGMQKRAPPDKPTPARQEAPCHKGTAIHCVVADRAARR